MIKTWGKIISLIADETLKVYQYELKVTALFQDILSTVAFGNFILFSHPSLKLRQEWVQWYNKVIRAYSYYTLLPAIAKTHGDEIQKYPFLREYFAAFPDYMNIWNRIQREDEYDRSDQEGIAKAFSDFFSPICKLYMGATGTLFTFLRDIANGGAYAIWDIAKKKKFDIRSITETVLQRYRGISMRMRVVNIPPEFYYQQRPTLDFDIVTLFAHINSYMAYKKLIEQDIEAQKNSPLHKSVTAQIEIDGKKYADINLGELMKINFCISKEDIEKLKGKPLDIEVGGVVSE